MDKKKKVLRNIVHHEKSEETDFHTSHFYFEEKCVEEFYFLVHLFTQF